MQPSASLRYWSKAFASLMEQVCETDTSNSKRKAQGDASIAPQKRQKKLEAPTAIDEATLSARAAEAAIQPISDYARTTPLNSIEKWRLRGWTWSKGLCGLAKTDGIEVQSPRGTNFETWS
jgi:hypothetical protein